jgi:hypothetical protein
VQTRLRPFPAAALATRRDAGERLARWQQCRTDEGPRSRSENRDRSHLALVVIGIAQFDPALSGRHARATHLGRAMRPAAPGTDDTSDREQPWKVILGALTLTPVHPGTAAPAESSHDSTMRCAASQAAWASDSS